MKRSIALILALGLLLVSLWGCTAGTGPVPSPSGKTVTDGSGRQVAVPENPEESVIASVYAVAVPFFVALEVTDRVKAVNVKSNFWKDADEHLEQAGTVGRGVVDLEALAALAPTVLVHRSNDDKTVEAVEGTLSIPVLTITVENLEDVTSTLAMMGTYFGKEERAQEVSDWIAGKFQKIEEIVSTIPQEQRVTALVLGSQPGRVAGGDMMQSVLIEKAGGISVAKDTAENRNWVNVGTETVFAWDPQFLFATSSTPLDYTLSGLMEDPVWADLEAIKKKQVYQIPAGIDTWDMPGISCPLAAMFMLHKMYPAYFSREELEQEIDAYYLFLFGTTFDPGYLGIDLD